MAVPHLKGGKIIWTCVEDGIIVERRITKQSDYLGSIINGLKKRMVLGLDRAYMGIHI